MNRSSLSQDRSARRRVRGRVEQPLEQLAVALDGNAAPAALDEQVVEALDVRFDDHVWVLDRARPGLAVDEVRHLSADAELEGAGRSDGREDRVERAVKPARGKLVVVGWRTDRPEPPERQLAHGRLEPLPVRGQLVDLRGRRRIQAPLGHDATALEVLESRGQDVRADAWKARREIGVPLRALQKLPNDQERPALANEAEGMGDRAVLVVALAHGRSVARPLAVVKNGLAKDK